MTARKKTPGVMSTGRGTNRGDVPEAAQREKVRRPTLKELSAQFRRSPAQVLQERLEVLEALYKQTAAAYATAARDVWAAWGPQPYTPRYLRYLERACARAKAAVDKASPKPTEGDQ